MKGFGGFDGLLFDDFIEQFVQVYFFVFEFEIFFTFQAERKDLFDHIAETLQFLVADMQVFVCLFFVAGYVVMDHGFA